MLDARYHLFYLIAIFLMLSFGILIGASYYGPVQVRQQRKAFDSLLGQTNLVVQERKEAQARLDKDEAALSTLRPKLIRGKLAGQRVILVQTGDYADATEAANTALEDAGAVVPATVTLTAKWATLSPRQRKALQSVAGSLDPAVQNTALPAALASALVRGTDASPVSAAALEAIQAQGLVIVSGELTQPCKLFVLVGGSRDDSTPALIEGPLLEGLKAAPGSVTVVGCEPYTASVSSIPAYQAAGISSVDCIDLPLGQIALPFALRGDTGDYGLKPTARLTLPAAFEGSPAP